MLYPLSYEGIDTSIGGNDNFDWMYGQFDCLATDYLCARSRFSRKRA